MKASSCPNLNRETTSFPNFFTLFQDPDHHHHDTSLKKRSKINQGDNTEASVSSPFKDILSSFLTYAFTPGTRADAKSAVARAFNTWASQTKFRFSQSPNFASADLKIGFYRGDHGDGAPFNGASGVLAHAFAPTDGRFHYNADYLFSENPAAGLFHMETVALHEIRHLLGLRHSSVEAAIMWSSIPVATVKGLHADDIQGINTLYDLEPVRISSFVFQCTV
ncbi:hypothetical protein RHSIM_Rhsim08G0060000 [Rhododendron simsii]|uniref:Peptidase metallopeptidase domain-containing protein n=1 Tax=Rhododendron simsii TaxID=118357 RepID=A0A834GM31_RHOSS|nr:hypothetical protein RHSIM_Rhsim08G0060000 [Rhododendron simsii]